MSLHFLSDHCVPTAIIRLLEGDGHQVTRVRDVLPTHSPDTLVIATATQLDCILLSLNGDFSDIVAYPTSRFRGIIAIQLHNRPELLQILMAKLSRYFRDQPFRDH